MSTDGDEVRVLERVIEWMKQNAEPIGDSTNAMIIREIEKVYVGSRDILATTLIGVIIGVLTNVSASFLLNGSTGLGLTFLLLSLFAALLLFYLWRFYLTIDLQHFTKKLVCEQGKSLTEKFERDFADLKKEHGNKDGVENSGGTC